MQSAKCNRCGESFVHTSRTARPSQMHEDQVGSLHLCPDFVAFSELMQFQCIWCLWSVVKLGGLRIWGRSPNFLIPMGIMSTGFLWFWNGACHTNGLYVHVTCVLIFIYIYLRVLFQNPLSSQSHRIEQRMIVEVPSTQSHITVKLNCSLL